MDMLLNMLKVDLGIRQTTAYDARLTQLLTAAQAAIAREGVDSLDIETPEDAQLVVMYAYWLWKSRNEMTGMPRRLRLALNNRKFKEVAEGGEG